MGKVIVRGFAVSLDGFAAGPRQDLQNPLGVRGPELMEWFFPTRVWRAMQGQDGGETGIDNRMAEPAFVLTHHARKPLAMKGGTTFHFVTEGIHAALAQARAAAGAKHIRIGGGAATVRQYLQAGLIDELHLALRPVLLGAGESLLAG